MNKKILKKKIEIEIHDLPLASSILTFSKGFRTTLMWQKLHDSSHAACVLAAALKLCIVGRPLLARRLSTNAADL